MFVVVGCWWVVGGGGVVIIVGDSWLCVSVLETRAIKLAETHPAQPTTETAWHHS